jgi:hypothetical protein
MFVSPIRGIASTRNVHKQHDLESGTKTDTTAAASSSARPMAALSRRACQMRTGKDGFGQNHRSAADHDASEARRIGYTRKLNK